MFVDKVIRTPDGPVHVNCTFSEEEADLIVTIGLTRLLEVGAIPFSMIAQEDAANFGPGGNG